MELHLRYKGLDSLLPLGSICCPHNAIEQHSSLLGFETIPLIVVGIKPRRILAPRQEVIQISLVVVPNPLFRFLGAIPVQMIVIRINSLTTATLERRIEVGRPSKGLLRVGKHSHGMLHNRILYCQQSLVHRCLIDDGRRGQMRADTRTDTTSFPRTSCSFI